MKIVVRCTVINGHGVNCLIQAQFSADHSDRAFLLRKLWSDAGQAQGSEHTRASGHPLRAICPESNAYEVAARPETDRLGTNGIQKDLRKRD